MLRKVRFSLVQKAIQDIFLMQMRKRSNVTNLSLERAAANIQIIISQAELIFIFNFTILMYPLMRLQVLLALQLNF